jgi:class 3 adenylate cyclase
MNRPRRTNYPFHVSLRAAALVTALVFAAALSIWLNQPAAAALVPLIGLLCVEIDRRDRRARALARSIVGGRLDEKIEVRRGEWGDLSHAVNTILQEQRVQRRLRSALPESLPHDAVAALLSGSLPTEGQTRLVAVMLVRHTRRAPEWDERGRRAGLVAWRALSHAAQEAAQEHSALLQLCGDSILLAFGAFDERPAADSLRAALSVAETLCRRWRASGINAGGPLSLSLVSGHGLAAALPGLGYCVVGAPVEQALRLQQLALHSRRYGLLCSEEVYLAMRNRDSNGWRPTDLRISLPNRPPQVVYDRQEQWAQR